MPIKIGVLGTSDIAERRMIPAIKKIAYYEYVGVAIASQEEWGENNLETFKAINKINENRASLFVEKFGGKYYNSFSDLLNDKNIDVIYIPLPPSLHKKWITASLNKGKHVISEKPITCNLEDTLDVIELAKQNDLAIIENYGFIYHNQMKKVKEVIANGYIGNIRNISARFGFPHRKENDFRYSKKMGGGAILDCGGYTIKAISTLLGNSIEVKSSRLVRTDGHEVDIYGNAYIERRDGVGGFISFGMDNEYECSISIWGSKGTAFLDRAFTAPDNLATSIKIRTNNENVEIPLEQCDQFKEVLLVFLDAMNNRGSREAIFEDIIIQSKLVNEIIKNGVILEN